MRLEGKVALITGAARGQGAAEARMFAKEGAKVVLADVSDQLSPVGMPYLFIWMLRTNPNGILLLDRQCQVLGN